MSSKSNDHGRAFEYACIIELKNRIAVKRPVTVDEESVMAARRAWKTQSNTEQQTYLRAADAFIDTLFSAEPLILECDGDNDIVVLSINKDSDAEGGDVRDIVITRNIIRWDIGLSMKHNHFAAKHSRLSSKIDFGAKWYGLPCNENYWNTIKPIFARLQSLKEEKVAWHDMTDKEDTVYFPIVEAFIKEMYRAYKADNTIPARLISYLLGIRDFYKVVALTTSRRAAVMPTILSRVRTYAFVDRTPEQQREVISRVFHEETSFDSVSAYLESFLPVSREKLSMLACSFLLTVQNMPPLVRRIIMQKFNPRDQIPVEMIINEAHNFEPRILFSLFMQEILDILRVAILEKGISSQEQKAAFSWINVVRTTSENVSLYNQSTASALEFLSAELSKAAL